MELALNLVWVVLAAAMALSLALRRRGARPSRSEWLALLCVIALLFPVISMSDDMILATAYAETGRQDTIAATLSINHGQFVPVAILPALAYAPRVRAAFGFLGHRKVVPRSANSLWSLRVQKRPPPSV